jgi:glycosyltransferase involved in cell wall biosynthesis
MNQKLSLPKLTVIVPTRERADTLKHTIKTLIVQDYQNLEILICDNFSKDDTLNIVNTFKDSRINYVNSGARLSMSDNWEFALNHATGDFVTFIGDDDAFVPGAIARAMGVIYNENPDALVWQKIEYCWPDHIEDGFKNWISIKNFNCDFLKVNSQKKLNKVMKFHDSYTKLPCLYNSIVKISKINEVKKLSKSNKFFHSIAPDVYSGIVLSKVINNYIYTKYPFSINGASRHSNGTSVIRQSNDVKNSPYEKFKMENKLKYDDALMMVPSVSVGVIGEYLNAKKNISQLSFNELNWKSYINSLIRSLPSSNFPNEIIKSIQHTANSKNIKIILPKLLKRKFYNQPELGFGNDAFSFLLPVNVVSNIYDASKIVEGMMPEDFNYKITSAFVVFWKSTLISLSLGLKNLYKSI